jgi:hypothetical protein
MRDVRWLYLLVSAVVVFALLVKVEQPIKPNKAVQGAYDHIERLPPGSAVLIAMDFDPQAKAELEPMAVALLRHCLRRDLKVIGMTFWYTGNAFAYDLFQSVAREFPDKQSGRDYVYLGYQPAGMAQVITGMGENIVRTFPQEYENRPTAGMPIFSNAPSLKKVSYIVDLAAGDTPGAWIQYGGDKYKVPMAVGCTAVTGPDMYVRLDAGQIDGLIAGMRGAADYETLIQRPDLGAKGMFAQSVIHVMIIVFVAAGNLLFFLRDRARTGGEG